MPFPEVNDGGRVAVPTVSVPVADYKIVTAASAAALATAVKAQFSGGWMPYGSAQQFSASVFNQAMIKY